MPQPPTVPQLFSDLEVTRQWIGAATDAADPAERQAAAAVAQAMATLVQAEVMWLRPGQ